MVLFISDGLSQVKTTMFDDTLEVLLGKKFRELIAKDGYDDNTQLPEPIKDTVGKKWYFVLKPQREQYPNSPKFIVKQILHVDAVDKPLLLETPPPSTPSQAITTTTQLPVTKKRLEFASEGA